ncbi:RNA-binding protein [Asticcacaulis sp. 201]|uniref:RNA-binding protein n=1 Tax=Asticcacaulis sp. 201 TaxID=3028787 RepID=UPI002916D987|nr:RNA-binding protein [Asticcacaulis sp. 201]MDV6331422.1 RNA-binding protein [Asticcacaulis sp. 201]
MSPPPNNEPALLTDIDDALVLGESSKGQPQRRDIASGETVPTDGLIRFVVSPDGILTPDIAHKLPGRGLWVAADRGALEIALKKNIFSRAAKRQVKAEPTLVPLVHDLLRRRCLDLLGLARREGGIVNGFEKVLANVKSGKAAWVIDASDGAEDGRKRILSAVAAQTHSPNVCGSFSNAELSLALGTENAIHVALLSGRRVKRWSLEMKRLSGFETLIPEGWGRRPEP